MPFICYVKKRFNPDTRSMIDKANEIIKEYSDAGFDLTLRQLYYQFVARGLIANKQSEYSRLGSIVNDARLAGLIDWNHIVDRTRYVRSLATWSNPQAIIDGAAKQYRNDLWASQPYRVEVWIEKDALVGVIEGVCDEERVDYFSCRGYTSQSEMWGAAQRLIRYVNNSQTPIILHFGDHDPSGKDMTRDIIDRLNLFMGIRKEQRAVIERLALNMDQIEKYQPPPNPAKITDSRAKGYIDEFGPESWELDALEPAVIADLIRHRVARYRDKEQWAIDLKYETEERAQLEKVGRHWGDVTTLLARRK